LLGCGNQQPLELVGAGVGHEGDTAAAVGGRQALEHESCVGSRARLRYGGRQQVHKPGHCSSLPEEGTLCYPVPAGSGSQTRES
jgi:hypothetical protein